MEYITTKSLVAFVDVLGTSEAMKKDPNGSLNKIHSAYDLSMRYFRETDDQIFIIPNVNIFSDNILLSIEINDENIEIAIWSILYFCAILQMNMWLNGINVRGGIAMGSFFSDSMMVWGNALVQAHYLEESIAIYPRIILEPALGEILGDYIKDKSLKLICQDFDGLYFVDPLSIKNIKAHKGTIELLIKDNLAKLDETKENLRVHQKLEWLQRYWIEKMRVCDWLTEKK